MKCLIIEKDKTVAKSIELKLRKGFKDSIKLKHIGSLKEAWICLNLYQHPDFIILNDNLEDGDLGSLLEDTNVNCPIIVVSAREDLHIHAFNLNVFDFLTAPIQSLELKRSIQRIYNYYSLRVLITPFRDNSYSVYLKHGSKSFYTNVKQISFIKRNTNSSELITKDGSCFQMPENIDTLIRQLQKFNFFRINKDLLINVDSILKITYQDKSPEIYLKPHPTEKIPLPENKLRYFNNWLEKSSA